MKIERNFIPEMTLEEFADKYDLTLEINERSSEFPKEIKYYAKFKHVEIKDGSCLRGTFGNGTTEYEATINYINEISETCIVVDAMNSKLRREIKVPRLVGVYYKGNKGND